ncbi:MAG: hypothetical protein QXX41_05745 [Nitrososphaerota archaeon]
MTYTTAEHEVAPKAIPTTMWLSLDRIYAGRGYPRPTMVFGEYESLRIIIHIWNMFGLPVINVPIKIYVDNKHVATETTNITGYTQHIFDRGISPPGTHVIKCVWEGDFWNAPAEASITIRTVKMEEAVFTAYVETVAKASPAQVEQGIVDKCLADEIGVVPVKTEVDVERNIYILTILVPTESTSPKIQAVPAIVWAIIAAIIAIAAAFFAATAYTYVINVFALGYYQCGACGARFTTCEARREHMITAHPDLWEKIKDSYICESIPPPPPTDWLKWILYAGIGAVAVIVIIEIIKAVRR